MSTNPIQLAAKIAARNASHALAREFAPRLQEALRAMMGKKVLNAGNVLSKACRAKLEALIPLEYQKPCHRIWVSGRWHGVQAEFSCGCGWITPPEDGRAYGREGVETAETQITLAMTDRATGAIVELPALGMDTYRTDFAMPEVEDARQELANAKSVLEGAQSHIAITHFGEYE